MSPPTSPRTSPRTSPAPLRVATANVLHGRAGRGTAVDLERYAAGLAALDADVLALQEVDLGQERSGRADLAAIAARACGLEHWRFLPTYTGTRGTGEGWWPVRAGQLVPPGTPAYGTALLSRYPVVGWQELRLPRLPGGLAARALGSRMRDEPRGALSALVMTPLGPLTVVATHLSHVRRWNEVQLSWLRRHALGGGGPLVLLGDLNLAGAVPAAGTGLAPLAGALTFPRRAPDRQIDHLLGRGLRSTGSRAVDLGFSDHLALLAELTPAPVP